MNEVRIKSIGDVQREEVMRVHTALRTPAAKARTHNHATHEKRSAIMVTSVSSFVATSAAACCPRPLAASRRGGRSPVVVVTSSSVPNSRSPIAGAASSPSAAASAASLASARAGGEVEQRAEVERGGCATWTSSWRRTAAALAAGCYLTATLVVPPLGHASFMEELQQPSIMNLKLKERTQEAGEGGWGSEGDIARREGRMLIYSCACINRNDTPHTRC